MTYATKIAILLNSATFFKTTDSKEKIINYLTLEPLLFVILKDKSLTQKEITEKLYSFTSDTKLSDRLFNHFHTQGYFEYSKNEKKIKLSEKNNKQLDYHNQILLENSSKWNKIISAFSAFADSADPLSSDEYFYTFFDNIFKNNFGNFLDSNKKEVQIANFLNYCCKEYVEYFVIFLDLLQGFAILYALINSTSNYKENKKPKIFIDNMFIGHLFGWCDELQIQSAQLMYQCLKDLNFEIYIHDITVDVLYSLISKFRQFKLQNLQPQLFSLYYYMLNCHDKSIVNASIFPSSGFKPLLIQKISQWVNHSNVIFPQPDKDSDLYIKIKNFRQDNIKRKGIDKFIFDDEQTTYDYQIITHYSENQYQRRGNNLSEFSDIFLTNQSAILNNYNNKKYTYSPIMHFTTFMKLILIDTTFQNLTINNMILKGILLNVLDSILSQEVSRLFSKALDETNLSDEDRSLIYAMASDTNMWSEIISTNNADDTIRKYKSELKKMEEMKIQLEQLTKQVMELKKENAVSISIVNNNQSVATKTEISQDQTSISGDSNIQQKDVNKEKSSIFSKVISFIANLMNKK